MIASSIMLMSLIFLSCNSVISNWSIDSSMRSDVECMNGWIQSSIFLPWNMRFDFLCALSFGTMVITAFLRYFAMRSSWAVHAQSFSSAFTMMRSADCMRLQSIPNTHNGSDSSTGIFGSKKSICSMDFIAFWYRILQFSILSWSHFGTFPAR